MAQVLTKPDMREYVLKLFASFLHGATKEQKFYVWTGSGANSKSKLVELFELAFGDYCCKLPVTLLTQKRAASNAATSEVAKAKGKRFACMQEPSEDEKMNVGLMKELSGGDKIMARCIYKEPIEFKPQFKMVLLCNHLPDVPSDDGGTWRRIRVVEFTSKFVEKPNPNSTETEFPIDVGLTGKLEAWKESFMGLLIRVYRRYIDEGIIEPDEVMRCTNEYKKQNDHMAEFVETRIEREPSCFLPATELYMEAKAFARDANIARFAVKATFEKYVERSLNTKLICINGVKGFRGFRMRVFDLDETKQDQQPLIAKMGAMFIE
jgi:P4 family phage/plasmid primase-like protien